MASIPVNKAKEIVFVVPQGLPNGHWQVRIITQYSGSTGRLLKTPRVFTCDSLLTM